MPIPRNHVDKLLADCGRRCCLCRRFRPLLLQVHHIKTRGDGGSDEPENLIALCVTCHSSVHTKTGMTRNFTAAELRQHRDNAIAAVRDGRLVQDSETPEMFEAIFNGPPGALLPAHIQHTASGVRLLPESAEVLLAAVRYGGRLIEIKHDGGWILQCVPDACIPQGGAGPPRMMQFGNGTDHRTQALYQAAFKQLVNTGLVGRAMENLFDVTHDGYLLADQLIAAAQLGEAQPEATP